jgi:hypothetical protein
MSKEILLLPKSFECHINSLLDEVELEKTSVVKLL